MKQIFTRIIIVVAMLSIASVADAAVTLTKINSASEITEGYYFICAKNSSGKYFNTVTKELTMSVFRYQQLDKFNTAVLAYNSSNILLKFIKLPDDQWAIKELITDKYVAVSLESPYVGSVKHIDSYEEDVARFTFADAAKNQPYISVVYNNKRWVLRGTELDFQTESNISKNNYSYPEIYRVNADDISLDDNTSLNVNHLPANVSLARTFADGNYNTLMLPFDVSDYKSVFGMGVEAYKLQSAADDAIAFVSVDDDEALFANQPYLLNGTFSGSPYAFSSVYIDSSADAAGIAAYTLDGISFNGVYQTGTDLGNTDAFILYMNKFYICDQVASMPISPFRWYVEAGSASADAKRLVVNGEDSAVPSSVALRPAEKEGAEKGVFQLDGRKTKNPLGQLPKGIYIVDRKKVLVH